MSLTIRTPEKRLAFLTVLAESGMISKACSGAGIGRTAAYAWRKEDPEFAKAWDEALEIGVGVLEDEAHRRGFDGVEKPIFHQGVRCGEWRDANGKVVASGTEGATWHPHIVRDYSDTLAIFLLKAHRPEKYRERFEGHLSGDVTLNLTFGGQRG